MLKSDLENLIKEWDRAILGWENVAKSCDVTKPDDLGCKDRSELRAYEIRLCKIALQEILDRN